MLRRGTESTVEGSAAPVGIACGRCRTVRSAGEWSALPLRSEIGEAEVASHVSRWPADLVVVVRTCTCGAPIARLAPRRAG
ncbi:MAG: hypothetical protein KF894_27590 [Labilithrix sp.]|nr:hypothetical protein [Labilithrix sp.]